MFRLRPKTKKLDQKGMVSIIVTVALIVVMTLIVSAMVKNSNRESRQSLDRQLSDQAFYNAMTGINDWVQFIQNNPSVANSPKTNCDPSTQAGAPPQQIDANGNSVTCILYNKAPTSLQYTVTGEKSATFNVQPGGTDVINELMFTVRNSDYDSTPPAGDCGGAPSRLKASIGSATCNVDALEITLVPKGLSTLNRTNLINETATVYLFPSNGGVVKVPYGSNKGVNQGGKYSMDCTDTSKGCVVTIDGLSISASTPYLIHIKSIYNIDSVVDVAGATSAGVAVSLSNAQLLIDATGKASDVLRRVQVRVPIKDADTGVIIDNSLRTTSTVCKLLTVNQTQSTVTVDSDCPIN